MQNVQPLAGCAVIPPHHHKPLATLNLDVMTVL